MTAPDAVLDCRGMACPRPIIELARHLTDVEVGELLGVASDDPAARHDVPAWCRLRSQEYAGEATAPDGVPIYLVRRVD